MFDAILFGEFIFGSYGQFGLGIIRLVSVRSFLVMQFWKCSLEFVCARYVTAVVVGIGCIFCGVFVAAVFVGSNSVW